MPLRWPPALLDLLDGGRELLNTFGLFHRVRLPPDAEAEAVHELVDPFCQRQRGVWIGGLVVLALRGLVRPLSRPSGPIRSDRVLNLAVRASEGLARQNGVPGIQKCGVSQMLKLKRWLPKLAPPRAAKGSWMLEKELTLSRVGARGP